jgi:hypothetical protein
MGNKNDVMDARVIWMAVQQQCKAVAVKSEEQQAVAVLLVKFRSAQINELHGLPLEFGETVRKGRLSLIFCADTAECHIISTVSFFNTCADYALGLSLGICGFRVSHWDVLSSTLNRYLIVFRW